LGRARRKRSRRLAERGGRDCLGDGCI
jgi:hypothetical protein